MRPLHDGEGCEHHSAHPTGRMPTQGYTQGVWLHSTVLLETLRRVSQHSASRSSQENTRESWVLACCGILRSDWQKGGLGVMGKVPRWIKGAGSPSQLTGVWGAWSRVLWKAWLASE